MITAFEVMKYLMCCNECNFLVAYANDSNARRNRVVYVNDTISKSNILDFEVDVRGEPYKGETTTDLAKQIIQLDGVHYLEFENGKLEIKITTGVVKYNGVDDFQRTSLSIFINAVVKEDIWEI